MAPASLRVCEPGLVTASEDIRASTPLCSFMLCFRIVKLLPQVLRASECAGRLLQNLSV